MTNEEINQTLHQFMGKTDWHLLDEYTIAQDYINCNRCDATVMEHFENNPNYTVSLDAVAPVEAKVIEVKGDAYLSMLYRILDETKVDGWITVDAVTAPANVRALACYEVITNKENKSQEN